MEPQRSLRARPLQGKFIISLNNISRTWNTFIFLKSTSIPKPNGSNFRCSGALSPSGDNRDERLIFHQWHFCMNTCTRVYIHTHTHTQTHTHRHPHHVGWRARDKGQEDGCSWRMAPPSIFMSSGRRPPLLKLQTSRIKFPFCHLLSRQPRFLG